MAEYEASPIANRDEPIPVFKLPNLEDEPPSAVPATPQRGSKREALKEEAEKLKNRLHDVGAQYKSAQGSVQERLFTAVLEQIFPTEVEDDGTPKKDRRSTEYVERPGFSLPTMSANFRRFNARIGIVFVVQNVLIRLFTWRVPTQTLSFLALYTLVCLQPALLPVLPIAAILFFVMVPSFLSRHPPPPATNPAASLEDIAAEQHARYGYSGPAVAPPQRVKPAPDMSKDFFRNMRDLQNSMEDFSRAHDGALAMIMPYTDFGDERLSSTIFLFLGLLLVAALLSAQLVPWSTIALLTGWAMTCAGHPEAQDVIMSASSIKQIKDLQKRLSDWFDGWVASDIALDEPAEAREVEVFELQKLQRTSTNIGGVSTDAEWEPWLFTPNPYDPMSPARIAGARPSGTQFFEEVQPPKGWRWRDKKWTLDLGSREWVEERCVTGVEIDIEGERWVYDIGHPDVSAAGQSDKSAGKMKQPVSWEEGNGRGRTGEWRRRRWVRIVERKVVKVRHDK